MCSSVSSVQFSRSVVSDSVTPRTAERGFSVLYQLPELSQAQIHRVSDAIQPFHLLLPPSPSALNLSHHQGLLLLKIAFLVNYDFLIIITQQFIFYADALLSIHYAGTLEYLSFPCSL